MRVNFCLAILVLAFQMSRGIISPGKRVRKANSSSPALHCTFDTVKYNISQTWYPLLLPYGYISCIKCVCEMSNEGAKVVCKRKECKKLTCVNAHIKDGECCKKCPGSSQSQYSQQPASSCSYMGGTYPHGKVWDVPSRSDSNNSEPNQCTDCSCSDGFVSCAIRTCPKLTCHQPVASPNSCCNVCPSKPKPRPPGYKPGCWSLGRHYQEDEKWHPLLDAYKTKCIICVCKNSSIRCSKVSCDDPNCIPRCCENCRAGFKVSSKPVVLPGKPNPVTPRKPTVPYPDCNLMGVHKHNTSWTPIVADSVSNCIKCECMFSKVRCSRISCPSTYPCAKPVVKFGECCKFCEGSSNQHNKISNKLRHCGSAKSWNVYEYKTRLPSTRFTKQPQPDPQEIKGHFVLESVQKQKIEIHTLRANRTHKTVRVKAMYRTAFKRNMSPWMTLKPIGVIREGRRRTIEEKEKKKCRVGMDCRKDVKSIMRMVRIRSRRCRAIMTIPPVSLLRLTESINK